MKYVTERESEKELERVKEGERERDKRERKRKRERRKKSIYHMNHISSFQRKRQMNLFLSLSLPYFIYLL